ncbi:DMP19 family protein [Amantichitinum ursilacus]|uniref:DNA mimic protein DMP19 C-terminal domain-containing protein n=1 Tax=Amantichitinum ursilacus TaxID=857265 RepID=A0A0N0XHT3_9NEIS|nr:hypothetical protein [Amantichitinum ursilacus]KPC49929.1 hypothetical protein WG78_18775 [Amantichitinum ursilacus]
MDNDEYAVLDLAYQKILAKLPSSKGTPLQLEECLRNFMLVYHAQGILDNGGVEFMMSAAFPGGVQYLDVADAYEFVGLKREAEILRNSIELVGRYEIETALDLPEWKKADSFLIGNEEVWLALRDYLRQSAPHLMES